MALGRSKGIQIHDGNIAATTDGDIPRGGAFRSVSVMRLTLTDPDACTQPSTMCPR
jgi:hypothetical protein